MKKFFLKILLLIFLLFLLDFIAGLAMSKFYERCKYGILGRQLYGFHECNENLIVFGSSRACHHYLPEILQDSLKVSVYNMGSDGMCIVYDYAMLEAILKRHVPKCVLLELVPEDFVISFGPTFNLEAACTRLAPQYGENEKVDSIIEQKSPLERIKLCSTLYRYNYKFVQMAKCSFIPSFENKGYEAVNGAMSDKTMKIDNSNYKLDLQKFNYLKSFVQLCKKNKINLNVIVSPMFITYRYNPYGLIRNYISEQKVNFINLANDPYFMNNHALFADPYHLNDKGAHLYSAKVANLLKRNMQP